MLNNTEKTNSNNNGKIGLKPFDPKKSPEFLISDIVTLTEIWTEISDQYSGPEHSQVFLLFREIQDRAERALAIVEAEAQEKISVKITN